VIWYKNVGTAREPRLAAAQPVDVEWNGPQPALAWGWLRPEGKGLLTQWRTTPLAVDWNKDGLTDLVLLAERHLYFLAQTPERTLAEPVKIPVGSPVKSVQVLDVDGDQRSDLLLVELDPAALYAANVEADNYGNRYTGEYRLGATLALNSPLKIGDQLTARALISNEALIYARLAYQLPVGSSGLKVGGAYSDTNYTLGKEFASLQAHGTARSVSLYATYPFIRSQDSNLYGTFTWEQKKLVDRTDVPVSLIDKQVRLYNLGLAGNHRDALGGAGYTSFDAALIAGRLNMDTASLALDATTARSDGDFARLTYSLNRLQRITDADSLSLVVSGQQASKNLNSSEKFCLGGASGVRAYPQGEGNGDEGWLANLELRHSFMGNLQAVAFYDAGAVNINHTAYSAAANTRNIAGAGVGLNAQYKALQFKTALAWSTHGGQAQAEPATMGGNPRLWVQVGGTF